MKDYTVSRIREFILDDHPCVMAQSVFADDSVEIVDYEKMHDPETTSQIINDLKKYIIRQNENSTTFESFIAVFKKETFLTEIEFEEALWKFLKQLHEQDFQPWDPETSSDVSSKKFSFSLLGTSFYVVGMHPMSSRLARKSPYPMIVFNLHNQFEKLREIGRYKHVRDLIRRRDRANQGSMNPMLEDFGESSEARQYSGRAVEENWKCPYSFDS
ncbi:MAG: guanitoxin biosynthesis heme-dependent pre-guanitoxin N-hydroxylase GntA [Nonlabens sp.]